MEKLLLKVEDVAQMTSLGRSKIYELIATGQLGSVSIGRARRIPIAALTAWLSAADEMDRADGGQFEPVARQPMADIQRPQE